MESRSENKPKKGIIICRVSTAEQARKGTSLESQEAWGRKKAAEMNVEIIKIIKEDISGERFLKENCESILKLVEEHDLTHIFVHSLDRLSRSFPYGVMLVQQLWEKDVQIVTSTFTPNPSKSNDRLQVWLSLLFAEIEHGGIHERTKRGIITRFKSGIYPLPWLPFGSGRDQPSSDPGRPPRPFRQFPCACRKARARPSGACGPDLREAWTPP